MTGIRLFALALIAAMLMAGGFVPTTTADARDAGQARQERVIRETLASKKIDLSFDEAAFPDVIDYIQVRGSINIVVDPNVLEDVEDETISLTLKGMTLGNALSIVLDFVELTYTFRHGVLWVTTPEESWKGRTILRLYDVRDLTFKIRNFPGTRIRLRGNEDGAGGGPIWEDEDEQVEEVTTDLLEEIIPEAVEPHSWDENPEASILQVMGLLVIRQTPEVHIEIARLLNQLRANR